MRVACPRCDWSEEIDDPIAWMPKPYCPDPNGAHPGKWVRTRIEAEYTSLADKETRTDKV
jgi:hypothetical protein